MYTLRAVYAIINARLCVCVCTAFSSKSVYYYDMHLFFREFVFSKKFPCPPTISKTMSHIFWHESAGKTRAIIFYPRANYSCIYIYNITFFFSTPILYGRALLYYLVYARSACSRFLLLVKETKTFTK